MVSVVHIVRILFRGEIEATDPHVVWQEQHWRVSYTEVEVLLMLLNSGDILSTVCDWGSHTLSSTLCPMRLTEREETF